MESGYHNGIIGRNLYLDCRKCCRTDRLTVAENVDGKIKAKGSVSGIVIIILSVLLILGIIVGLGFASVYLFSQENTTAGFAAALVSFFFVVLFIAVTVNVIKIKNRNKS